MIAFAASASVSVSTVEPSVVPASHVLIFFGVILLIGALLSAACAFVVGRRMSLRSPFGLAIAGALPPFLLLVALPIALIAMFGKPSLAEAIDLFSRMNTRGRMLYASALGVDLIAAYLTIRLVRPREGRARVPDPGVFE
jgi:hypothetical protein|tara:strand:- start:170 stop:589 length:420 start_codon:yes stop_codon:yes gene_type:complete